MYCFFFLMRRRPPRSIRTDTLFPYTTLFRSHVYATTVRKRGVTKPVVTPEEAAREIHAATGRSAYVFGPERSGLETEDVALARKILTVPINPQFGPLNLAQAVILCAYGWSKQASLEQPTGVDLGQPAPKAGRAGESG